MKILRTAAGLLALLFSTALSAQTTHFVTGTITDKSSKEPLPGVTILISPPSDSGDTKGTVTDINGSFIIQQLSPGKYIIRTSYIGYSAWEKDINIIDQDVSLGNISMNPLSTTLKGVTVKDQQIRAQQLGDTTQFNADAFKTNPDANAEDLLKKMPGIMRENGKITVGGEEVKRVLVDGKEFFGDDPETAVKNLPAEVIEKIQVFDRMNDQSRFTGFDDGESEKTINIITRPGKNKGNFGKLYGGYGTDERYNAGGNINLFSGKRRVSILAMSNNINQQNFSTDDLLGALGTSGNQRRGRGFQRGSDINNFLVGQQGGITATNAIGLNYSDNWGKKIKVSGSYFFNQTGNDNNSNISRQYFTSADSSLVYNESGNANTQNLNHRMNLRLEYTIDSSNSIILNPRLSIQDYHYKSSLNGVNTLPGDVLNSRTLTNSSYNSSGYNFTNDATYRHSFRKKGRTISLRLRNDLNTNNGDGTLYSLNEFVNSDTTLLDQENTLASGGYRVFSNLSYTEPIGKNSQLALDYRPYYTYNSSDREANNLDNSTSSYSDLDTTLSNKYENTYTMHRLGLSYRYNKDKLNFSAGISGQQSALDGTQEFPYNAEIRREFRNIVPNAMLNYKFSKTKNLRVYYRGDIDEPGVSQLQNVLNNTNPLLLKTGNANLVQDYEHRLIFRYSAANPNTNRNIHLFTSANYIFDYIGTQTIIPTKDTVFSENIFINKGAQISRPVNIDGYASLRSFLTYSMPVLPLKSNLNLNGGLRLSRTPALINNLTNYSNNYGFNSGFTLSSNISENVDFTISYDGNYTVVKNTIQAQSDNSYYSQTTSAKLNLLFLKGFVFNTDINHYLYSGLSQSFNQNFLLWNAALGYKFLKNRALEAKVSVYDILNQNRAIARTVSETYIEDSYTDVLQQYFMLTLTYTLRNFNSTGGN